ncbi:MAG: SET domain-containing protein-lysine N-methyltransferase [Hyphomonas sp.]|nr:SET domain-containing protein-lysine N-methyltransferase [Hyphomonas sp.]
MSPKIRTSSVEVKVSPLHGRGLYAAEPFRKGAVIGIYPLLILSHADTKRLKKTRLYHYVFYVDENEAGEIRSAVAFGMISMCNHSTAPNAAFAVNAEHAVVKLKAARSIKAGEEILIDYEDFADVAV